MARDWTTAAEEGVIDATGNPGVVPRNAANRALWLAAAHVEAHGLDPAELLWEPPAEVPYLTDYDRQRALDLVTYTLNASVVEGLDEARRGR